MLRLAFKTGSVNVVQSVFGSKVRPTLNAIHAEKSAMLDRSRFWGIAATGVLDAGWLPCQNGIGRSAMFFMAYSPQPTVAVDTNYRSGNARLDQEKGRRALRRRPCPASAGSRAGSERIHVPTSPTTQRALEPGQCPIGSHHQHRVPVDQENGRVSFEPG
jgi:hypothetical protein